MVQPQVAELGSLAATESLAAIEAWFSALEAETWLFLYQEWIHLPRAELPEIDV